MDEKFSRDPNFIEKEIDLLKELSPADSRVSCISVRLDENGQPSVEVSFDYNDLRKGSSF